MNFIPYDRKNIEGVNKWKPTKNYKLLKDFAESGLDCAKVEDWDTKTASYCAASLNISIKRYHLNHIRAISRGGCVYLIRAED